MNIQKQYLPAGSPGTCWLRSTRRIHDRNPRRHRELVAIQVVSGSMQYLLEDSVLNVGSGELLWIFSDQSHLLIKETADFDAWVFVFAPETLLPASCPPVISSESTLSTKVSWLEVADQSELTTIANALVGQSDFHLLETGLRWWAMRAWAASRALSCPSHRKTHRAVRAAAMILENNPSLSLLDVAEQSGLSLSRLGRLFKTQIGQSLNSYRTSRRLVRIDFQMAQSSPPPLLTLALDVGFGSYTQFYRVFRATRGRSPRDYYSKTPAGIEGDS